jgi:uncharacterized membrane protein
VNPSLIDLVAALATGVVGSVALVRSDISDTLPGVAIAISLVPPLSVVGLTLESDAPHESAGALFLFATNVASILATGIVVMALYRVHRMVPPAATSAKRQVNRRNAVLVIVAFFLVIGGTLIVSAVKINDNQQQEAEVRDITLQWADDVGWEVIEVSTTGTNVNVRLIGTPPIPETESYAVALESVGIDPSGVVVEFVPQTVVNLGESQLPE